MEEKIIIRYKKKGQTPLEIIQKLKKENDQWRNLPMTYAGRLDPLAEGVLIVLVGDECLKKDEYTVLSKEYEVRILFGFETDTYDVMGKVVKHTSIDSISIDEITKALKNFTGRITQAYPPYSSRTVGGKPLFQWAREGKLEEITIPSHDVSVDRIDVVKNGSITGVLFERKIIKDISSTEGDFRQKEILELWSDVLKDKKNLKFQTVTLRVVCSSGVYIRCIAHELGKALHTHALALDIVRTKVGDYSLKDTKKID